MRTKFTAWILIFFGVLFGAASPVFGGNHKVAELNRKVEEISALQLVVGEKIHQAAERIVLLNNQLLVLKDEISLRAADGGILLPEAVKNDRRIDYNLRLIQRLYLYHDGLQAKRDYLQTAYATLEFYRQQVKDDVLIIEVLDDMEVDDLIDEIDRLLALYIPVTKNPLVLVDQVPKRDLARIRKTLVGVEN